MVMEVISQSRSSPPISSSLNPNAPMFVPLAYRTVEDFSDEWWAFVQSSPSFRDYWLQERFHDSQNDPDFLDIYDSAPFDFDALFQDDPADDKNEEVEEEDYAKQLVSLGGLKWRKCRALSEAPRFFAKAPKIVNVKVSPRTIQQPR